MVLSTALFDQPAFKHLIVNGLVLAEDGQKMSKRKQNYPPPNRIFDEYGADALRLYLVTSPVVHADSLKYDKIENFFETHERKSEIQYLKSVTFQKVRLIFLVVSS